MKLLSLSFLHHDSGMTFVKDGHVVNTILAERISKRKHDHYIPTNIITETVKNNNFDTINISVFNNNLSGSLVANIFTSIKNINSDSSIYIDNDDHHLCHAFSGFYSSPFTDALCIVIDGNGSTFDIENKKVTEIKSVYTFKNNKFEDVLFKQYCDVELLTKLPSGEFYNNKDIFTDEVIDKLGIGLNYEKACQSIGMSFVDGGKLMGLSQYYNCKDKLPDGYNTQEWKDKVNIAHKTQKYTEDQILEFVKKYLDQTGIKNVVLSGGVFLNCASNYNLIKNLDNVNIHVDPMCSDNGISIGRGLLSYYKQTKNTPNKIKNSYLGLSTNFYPVETCGFNYKKNISYLDIVNLIIDGNVVGLFQGQSEVGQRSLGNRSLLFDPRIEDGKTIVNRIKLRENYRPFAASIMLEHANNWFDMKSLDESQYMSFAVDALPNAIEKVPSVIHVNNTCRIQTVSQEQNYHFYNLINEFYNKTNIPMLLNTSFNLAGEPLVEIFDDAIKVMNNSELRYIYFPEIQTLLFK